MDRRLLDYLPPVLREVREFQAINEANEPEISAAWGALGRLMANQFLDTADSNGVSVWEKELGIFPKDTDTLEARKARVKAVWNLELPYTLPQLRNILEALCGVGNYSIELVKETYQLIVKIGPAAKDSFGEAKILLDQVVPQNIIVDLIQIGVSYAELGLFTHGILAAYTHEHLRNEVID